MKMTTLLMEPLSTILVESSTGEGQLDIDGRSYTLSVENASFLKKLLTHENVELRFLTDFGQEQIQRIMEFANLEGNPWRRVEEVAAPKNRKLSKSNNERWWKFDAFKNEIMIHPIRRLVWVDPDVYYHSDSIDNWLDPYGVLEEDRLYLDPDSRKPAEARAQISEFIAS